MIEVFQAHDIGYFFYIGGNDSMDTAHKVAALAQGQGLDLIATGVPKTIDNDVGDSEFKLVDHTPGYGSTARYWALSGPERQRGERRLQPGRPGAGAAGDGPQDRLHPGRRAAGRPRPELPLQIYLAESGVTLAELADNVNDELRRSGRCIVVVSEGFDVGNLGERRDSFGHTQYSASETTVAQVVVNYLNDSRPGRARRGARQRARHRSAPQHDLRLHRGPEEAYKVGQKAVLIAGQDGSGCMSTILRDAGPIYNACFDKVPLDEVANSERAFPDGMDRPEPPRRDRRLRALRPPADRRRLAHRPADRRSPALRPAAADLRRAVAARLHAGGHRIVCSFQVNPACKPLTDSITWL